MKNLPLPLAAICCALPVTTYCQKTSFGMTAGVSLANLHFKGDGISISGDSKIGVTGGVFADIPVASHFSFQPALNFVQKGSKTDLGDADYESKVTLNYIELPLNFLFKPEMQKMNFFVGAGPSIAYALSGKEKENDNGARNTYTYKFGNNPDEHDLKAMDFGANFLTGIETDGGFLLAINYNLGLSNLAPGSSSEDGKIKSRYFGLKVGFRLKK